MSKGERLIAKFSFVRESSLSGLYTDPPCSAAKNYPDVPEPDHELSPLVIAARWVTHDLHGEDMPEIAADLLESGHDTPSLRKLAGVMDIASSADAEYLVGKTFKELGVLYPISQPQANLIVSRQIAREVIFGRRNAWAAADYLYVAIWCWKSATADLETLFAINEEIDRYGTERRSLTDLTGALFEVFARLAVLSDQQIYSLRNETA
jgi:hypothetical protein